LTVVCSRYSKFQPMMRSIHFKLRASRRNILSLALTSAFCLCLPGQAVRAQQQLLSLGSPANAPRWVIGPAATDLGDSAQISVPEGCRFTDENGARVVLGSSKEPIPGNLVGLLMPESGQWFAIVQFTGIGYVKDADKNKLDADAILKIYQRDVARQNKEDSGNGLRAPITDISWELKPSFDPGLNKLEYAVKSQSAGGGSVNYVVTWLGRRGVLSVTTVCPYLAGLNLASMRDALKGITFKDGERYADYETNDRLARVGLAELITNANGAEPLSRWDRLAQSKAVWAGAASVFLVGGYFLTAFIVRRYKTRYYRMDRRSRRAPAVAAQSLASNGHTLNGNGQPHVELANGQPALRPGGGFQRNGHRRRKKHFSYHAFYSDMVMNLTRCNYVGSPGSAVNGSSANGNSVGHYSLPPQEPGNPSGMTLPDTASLLVAETSKLIQSQQQLIEGQRKLIEEQSKLIQEKSMLIDAETRVMDKQSQMLAEQHVA
jgi:uncharacterized membrane-anchored protein